MSPRDGSKTSHQHDRAERRFEVRALDGFRIEVRGVDLQREDGFLIIRDAQGVIVYCTPENRVADTTARPADARPSAKAAPAAGMRAAPKPEAPAPPAEPEPAPTPKPRAEKSQSAKSKQTAKEAGSNGGGREQRQAARLLIPAEAGNKAAGYLRADVDAQRAAALEQRLVESAEAAGYILTALYRDPASAAADPEEASGLRKLLEDAAEGFFATVMLCAPASSARDIAAIGQLSALLTERGLNLMVLGQDGVARPR